MRSVNMRYFVMAAVAIALLASPVLADTVYLKNGGKMVGKVTVKGDKVIVETELGTTSFSRKRVERIEKDDKTPRVPEKRKELPKKGAPSEAWKVLPDMPLHHVPYAEIEAGDKLVAYNPRTGLAIFGRVKAVHTKGENRTLSFEEPSKAFFQGSDAQVFSFYKIDIGKTVAKLLFFGCEDGDQITVSIVGAKKRDLIFRELSGIEVVVKEKGKVSEKLQTKTIYIVENHSLEARALESFLKSKGLKDGDSFSFTESDGTVQMGKLVKKEKGLEIESDVPGLKVDWGFVDRISPLSKEEFDARTRRLKSSKATYSPAVKPGDVVKTAVATYGKADMEGDGISGRIGIEGASILGLYARYFANAGLWISSRKGSIYEVETADEFKGQIFGLSLGTSKEEALKATDLYFYRANVHNPRILVSETLSPLRVEIMLDSKMEKIEKVRVTDPRIAGNWVVKAGVIMRRLGKLPGK
jgi:hypothetical protein